MAKTYNIGIIGFGKRAKDGLCKSMRNYGAIEGNDITAQTEQVMKNLGEVLSAAGASFESAIKTTCFLANMEDFGAFNSVYAQYFTGKPARSCVAVKTLPKNVLVEVEAIAVLK